MKPKVTLNLELKQKGLAEVETRMEVLRRFIREHEHDLSELRRTQKKLKDGIKRLETEPERVRYLLLVQTDSLEVDDSWIKEVVARLRACAHPSVWGLQGMGPGRPPVFRAEFEITADDRSACEYLEDVKSHLMYSGIDGSNSTIKEI